MKVLPTSCIRGWMDFLLLLRKFSFFDSYSEKDIVMSGGFSAGGLIKGIDRNSIVSQLMQLERQPIFPMEETPMDTPSINNKLLLAQDIIAELRAALDMSVEELAVNLDRSYEYFQYLLTQANIKKEPELLVECVELMMICMILGKSHLIIYRKRMSFLDKNQRLIYMGRLF